MDHPVVIIRGAGDLASGVALRLFRSGYRPIMTEVAEPLAVRRTVSFSESVYRGSVEVEGVPGRLADNPAEALSWTRVPAIPVLVDPDLTIRTSMNLPIDALIDARLLKKQVPAVPDTFVVGLGPGFIPGVNCSAVVETMRGHTLGRVYRDRPAAENTGLPEGNPARVLRTPHAGVLTPFVEIADLVRAGDVVAQVEGPAGVSQITAGVSGVVRGMLRPGVRVNKGLKIGDIDERADPAYCYLVSDKALAIGGGVLEALLAER